MNSKQRRQRRRKNQRYIETFVALVQDLPDEWVQKNYNLEEIIADTRFHLSELKEALIESRKAA